MRRTKAVQGVAAAAAPFFALARPSSLHALTRSLQAFSTLAAALAASLAGSTFGGAFGIAHTAPLGGGSGSVSEPGDAIAVSSAEGGCGQIALKQFAVSTFS